MHALVPALLLAAAMVTAGELPGAAGRGGSRGLEGLLAVLKAAAVLGGGAAAGYGVVKALEHRRSLPALPPALPAAPPDDGAAAGESRPAEAPSIDRVHFRVFAPPVVQPSARFVLQVWAALAEQLDEVLSRVRRGFDVPVEVGGKGPCEVARQESLVLKVELEHLRVEEPSDQLLWVGEPANAAFIVRVPEGSQPAAHPGTVRIFCQGLPLAKLSFTIRVGRATSAPRALRAREDRPRSAFASYARADRSEVALVAQVARKLGIDVFIDVVSLREGDRWEEVLKKEVVSREAFWLFWSRAAMASRWVDREWRTAYAARGRDYIEPLALEDPSVAPPPEQLDYQQFGDVMVTVREHARLARDTRSS